LAAASKIASSEAFMMIAFVWCVTVDLPGSEDNIRPFPLSSTRVGKFDSREGMFRASQECPERRLRRKGSGLWLQIVRRLHRFQPGLSPKAGLPHRLAFGRDAFHTDRSRHHAGSRDHGW